MVELFSQQEADSMRENAIAFQLRQSHQQGMQRGMERNAHETALRMIRTGRYPIEEISLMTGLPQEEIARLTKS